MLRTFEYNEVGVFRIPSQASGKLDRLRSVSFQECSIEGLLV